MAGNGRIYIHVRLATNEIEPFLNECRKTKTKNTL